MEMIDKLTSGRGLSLSKSCLCCSGGNERSLKRLCSFFVCWGTIKSHCFFWRIFGLVILFFGCLHFSLLRTPSQFCAAKASCCDLDFIAVLHNVFFRQPKQKPFSAPLPLTVPLKLMCKWKSEDNASKENHRDSWYNIFWSKILCFYIPCHLQCFFS